MAARKDDASVRYCTDGAGAGDQTAIGCYPSARIVAGIGVDVHLLAWMILGLVTGLVASKIINKSGADFLLDVILGIVGALAGGWLFSTFGMANVSGLNLYSFVVAVVGAMVVLMAHHFLIRGGR
jgi:uncharacterized membrane protein YeaQ/YmgE (transglycosylase-associated protein family)